MEDAKETGRVEAFSDGVFAVAITLLILNIQSPPLSSPNLFADDQLRNYVFRQWPELVAFVTSFATVGVMWLNHHRLFTHIKYADNTLLALNLLLLLIIVFIPYPTALLAQQYATHPEGRDAAIIYGATNVLMAICFNILWRYASHGNRLLSKDADPEEVRAISRQYSFGPIFYLITFALAWLSAPISVLLDLLLAIFFALPGRQRKKAE